MFRNKEYIYEIYKAGSFSQAARNLYITQPALSNSIRRIEERIGSPIFDRSTSPIQLTDVGRHYVRAIEKMLEAETEFSQFLADSRGLMDGDISIGSGALFASYLLPVLISRFRDSYPRIRVHILEESSAALEEMLSEGSLDLVLENTELPPAVFEQVPYIHEHMILAVPRSFPVNLRLTRWQLSPDNIISGRYLEEQYPVVPLAEFRDVPFIALPPEDDSHRRALELCREEGFEPLVALTLNQQLTAYNVTGEGIGASFISDTLVRYAPTGDRYAYYKLDPGKSGRSICFYYKRTRYLTRAAAAFLSMSCPGFRPVQ